MDDELLLALGIAAFIGVAVYLTALAGVVANAQVVEINITNETVYVSFHNFTIINFSTTHINIGWVNSSFVLASYSCLYAFSPSECHQVNITVYDGVTPRYVASFTNMSQLCTLDGVCYGNALFDVGNFSGPVRMVVKDLTTNETEGPFELVWPYTGPRLTGYAEFIPLIVPYGILISLGGRLGMRNVGIGLFVYGLIAPAMTVLGVHMGNIVLVSVLSIIMGVVFMWFGAR